MISAARWALRVLRGSSIPAAAHKLPEILPSNVRLEEETNSDYKPEHFYPVRLGEALDNRYEILAKLGFGSSSTVWLARDIHRGRWQSNRFYTLKILASEYFDQPYGNRELEISQWIANADPSHCGVNSLRTITDYFVVSGARNSHLCLVYEPMGEAITALQHCLAGDRIPPDILKELLKFMLLGLDYLHTKCGVIHTDIKPQNILLGLGDLSVMDKFLALEAETPLPRKLDGERVIYSSRLYGGFIGTGPPKLSDFGLAVRGDGPHYYTVQPKLLRAPEVFLGSGWSYSADIWNLGAIMWDLLENRTLFKATDPEIDEYTVQAHFAEMIALLGPAPMSLLQKGTRTSLLFTPEGQFIEDPSVRISQDFTLENAVTALQGEEKILFIEFVRKMLRWLPEERLTARELLDDPWINF